MSDLNTIDEIDSNLSEVMNTSEENETESFENETETETTEGQETLDDLMAEMSGKEKETDNNVNQKINNIEQNKKQQPNKQRGNNNPQDLVDANGNIIAKAGAERRFYEENVKLKREREIFNSKILPQLRENYTVMQNKVKAYDEVFKTMNAGDLSTDEIQTGIELIKQWKKSPQDTMKFLLTQAKSYGINVEDAKSDIDMSAIRQMIDEKFQPFVQERERALRTQQIKQSAAKTYNDFMTQYPDAKNHIKEIAYLLRKNPNMSLDAIYYSLRSHYAENGYDFKTPLAEILKNNSQKTTKTVPFNTTNTNQSVNLAQIKAPVASVNKSYNDIIKDVWKSVKK